MVKPYLAGAAGICALPTGGTTANTFYDVDTGGTPITKITGTNLTVISDGSGTASAINNGNLPAGSVAVLPLAGSKPPVPAFPFSFGDQLLLVDQNDVNDSRGFRSVEDLCPGCGCRQLLTLELGKYGGSHRYV